MLHAKHNPAISPYAPCTECGAIERATYCDGQCRRCAVEGLEHGGCTIIPGRTFVVDARDEDDNPFTVYADRRDAFGARY